MNERERKLLTLLGIAGFVILNLFLFRLYQDKMNKAQKDRQQAEQTLSSRKALLSSQEQMQGEVEWLANNEPSPVVREEAEASLQQEVESEAKRAGLSVKRQKILPAIEDGQYYHRVKAEFQVGGTEASLYRWLYRVYDLNKFQSVTYMRMFPQRKDDTKIDCIVVVERWFIPKDANATEEEGVNG